MTQTLVSGVAMTLSGADVAEEKRALRAHVLAARNLRSADDRGPLDRALATGACEHWASASVVAAYAAIGTEPPTRGLLDALTDAGATVLLPVIVGHELEWAVYTGWTDLVRSPLGLLEPVRSRVVPALAAAEVVLVPALAVDRAGHRLGRGGGFYDRALATVNRDRAVAVVYADELLERVPVEPHDREVGFAFTPGGLQRTQ